MRFDYKKEKYYLSCMTPFYVPKLPIHASMSTVTLSIKLQSTKIWDLTIKRKNIIFLVWLHFMFLNCPSMPPCQLQPYLHKNTEPSMSHERLKIFKTKKFEFETYEKSLDPTTNCNFPNSKLFCSLIWEHFFLSFLVSSLTRSRDSSKNSKKLSYLREKNH